MSLKNTKKEYGILTKTIHWLSALIVIGLLCLGLYMSGLEASEFKKTLYGLHKSFGIVVLVLILGRIGWHIHSNRPEALSSLKKWEKIFAKSLYLFFYAALIAMPLSGWTMSAAAGKPVIFFGLFTLPALVSPSKELGGLMHEIHEILGFILIGGIALHTLAALKHHLINKDSLLRRMLP